MEEVVTSVSFLSIEEVKYPLFKVTFAEGVRMDLAKIEATRKAYDGLSNGGKIRIIADLTGIRKVDKDARRALSDKHTEERIEIMAIVVRDPISRMIGNFLVGLNKPSIPLKLFTDFESARNWIEG